MYLVNVNYLKDFVFSYFQALQLADDDAKIAADVIVSADLRGIPSHGVMRLHPYYGKRIMSGDIDPSTPVKTLMESPISLVLDGANGLGQVVAYRAMEHCISKAENSGMAAVTVRNSNHYGIAGYYAMMALPKDMIGISLTNSQPLVAPTYGLKRMIGTNPIAIAIPAGDEYPFVLDMATSTVTNGQIVMHHITGQEVPLGWGINKEGELTNQPSEILKDGALLPLGGLSELRGYKGYGLAMMVDLLSGILAGSAFGENVGVPDQTNQTGVGHFFAAIKIDYFRSKQLFKADMDAYIKTLRNSPKLHGQNQIFIPGEKEFVLSEKHKNNGVQLLKEAVESLIQAGEEIGLPFEIK